MAKVGDSTDKIFQKTNLNVSDSFSSINNSLKRKKILDRIKSSVIGCANSCSTHGLNRIFKEKNLQIQIVWCLFVLMSSSICAYYVTHNVLNYFDYSVITEIREIDESQSVFPIITICSKIKYTSEHAAKVFRQIIIEKNFSNLFDFTQNNKINFKDSLNLTKKKETIAAVTGIAQSYNSTTRGKMGLSIDQFMLSCLFDGQQCTHSDFKPLHSVDYGTCIRFNSFLNNETRTIVKPGPKHGLTVELYLGLADELTNFYLEKGVSVSIDLKNDNPFFLHATDIIDVSPGQITDIKIKRSFFNHYPKPYSNCTLISTEENDEYGEYQALKMSSQYYQYIISKNTTYSQEGCFLVCLYENLSKVCNCSYRVDPTAKRPRCKNSSDYECVLDIKKETEANKLCNKDFNSCPQECKVMKFDHFISHSLFTKNYIYSLRNDIIGQNRTFINQSDFLMCFDENIMRLNFYFDSLSFIQYKESPSISLFSLISNVGGTLGLFLGMSILSILEIFEIILKSIFIFCIENFKN